MSSSPNTTSKIQNYLQDLSSQIDFFSDSLAIILAAGHGKRIKSETSKMLHGIWGVPTVVRVATAAQKGLGTLNQIIVVGIKAQEVAALMGRSQNRCFVFQPEQNGTGDAVRIALQAINETYAGDIYVFPGDMGLLDADAVKQFKNEYVNNSCDMMILTGIYVGRAEENYYGRVLRVPDKDLDGRDSGEDKAKVIEIKEQKDILALEESQVYKVDFRGRTYGYTKDELINTREFNTGVYVFRASRLKSEIKKLSTNNVQGELYLTDLIGIFNQAGLTVKASAASDDRTVLGFNTKSVLKEMEDYARDRVYEKLKDVISIADEKDFFIADEVVEQIIELDKANSPLDIFVGKGAWIGKDVQLNRGVKIGNHAHLSGNVYLGDGVRIHGNVHISAYPGQTLRVGTGSEIFKGDIVKGNLEIGENCRIESSVNMTGSDEFPTRIGNSVTIKGISYIFGSIVEDGIWIEHSVLKCKHIKRVEKKDGTVQAIRYFLPKAEGLEAIEDRK